MDLSDNGIKIEYPPSFPGAQSTDISFIEGAPDLVNALAPGESDERRLFVTDATVATLPSVVPFVQKFDDGICGDDRLLILGSGEAYKTIEVALSIAKEAIDSDFSRFDTFVGIGGGVICDITGFAASIFKRGASVMFAPTTLLAMVDASIGGKTGCDFSGCKNMIGSFFPARKIFMFPEFAQSLPSDQYRSGLAESLKTALLYDKELHGVFLSQSEKIKSRDKSTIDFIIRRCAAAKARVVERDFMEKNERMFLNYGHTFGHALESLAGLGNIAHGDAVAWGISRAVCLSHNLGLCNAAYKSETLSLLAEYGWETSGVPSIVTGGGFGERLLAVMRKDKKNSGGKIKVILQRALMDTLIEEVSDSQIAAALK